jgi:hypothetical protein
MNLEPCRECGKLISRHAKGCPHCGAKNKDISKHVIFGVIGGMLFLAVVFNPSVFSPNNQTSQNDTTSNNISTISDRWTYQEDSIGIDAIPVKLLILRSDQSIDLAFPYQGENYGHIVVRKIKEKRPEVIFTVDKGQFNNSYLGTKIKAKFDDKQSITFTGNPPSDHSSGVAFIKNPVSFIKSIQNSKKLRIGVEFFQQGEQYFDFELTGFDLSKLK